jgi:hypothetical protein
LLLSFDFNFYASLLVKIFGYGVWARGKDVSFSAGLVKMWLSSSLGTLLAIFDRIEI